MTKQPNTASDSATGRRLSELVSRVVSELRGLNFEFESYEDAAKRIVDMVLNASRRERDC